METPDPPNDTLKRALKQVVLTPHGHCLCKLPAVRPVRMTWRDAAEDLLEQWLSEVLGERFFFETSLRRPIYVYIYMYIYMYYMAYIIYMLYACMYIYPYIYIPTCRLICMEHVLPGWWFQTFFMFTPTWGNDSIWLPHIFPKWVVQPPTS